MQFSVTEPSRLYPIVSGEPEPVLLLGAGASVKSGVPLAGEVAARAARWAYALEKGRSPEDPTLQRSDWYPWLRAKGWYDPEQSHAENYPAVVEHLLRPRQNRKEFFRQLLNTEGVPPSPGYEKLAEMMARRTVSTVLTANFDTVLLDLCRRRRRPHHVNAIKTESDRTNFSTSPPHPQIVYLHGSVEHYTDKNLIDEVQKLEEKLVEMLVPLLRDHPLIVIGYRGGEPSIMRHLLMEQADRTNLYRHGIYWCVLKREWEEDRELAPLVEELADLIGQNFQVVPIKGFDPLFTNELWPRLRDSQVERQRNRVIPGDDAQPTYDMVPLESAEIDDLEWSSVRAKLAKYCKALDIRTPSPVSREWLLERLIEQNLAFRQSDETVCPTRAGYLLFAQNPRDQIDSANIILRVEGSPEWLEDVLGPGFENDELKTKSGSITEKRVIEGNLWNQLDTLSDALSVFNRPFRLKGEVSETVYPYPPLALKEVIVNALAHRNYEIDEPTEVIVEPSRMSITNPGGLVDQVRRQVGEGNSIEEEIKQGEEGIKGYRNPALADLFYGAGAMDKAGSGLSDVYRLVSENAGEVEFGPSQANDAFNVAIYSRPEAVRRTTATASPLTVESTRYAANILEFTQLPDHVWHVGTEAGNSYDIWRATEADWLPPFLVWNKRIYTFFDLNSNACKSLREEAGFGDVERLSLNSFIEAPGEENSEYRFIWLLKLYLHRHFDARGLFVDKKRDRTYFPRTEEGPRFVTYQARTRQATRKVVKPRKSSSGEVRYWEHQAVKFRIDHFGDTWGLLLLPTYVFTFNGKGGYLSGERTNKLSNRRAAHDYNNIVYNHLIFWVWVLSRGHEGSFSLELGPGPYPEIGAADDPREAGEDGESKENSSDNSADVEGSIGRDPLSVSEDSSGAEMSQAIPKIRLKASLPKAVTNEAEIGIDERSAELEEDLDDLDDELAKIAEEKRREVEGKKDAD